MRQTLVVSDPLADLARLEGVPSAVAAARDSVDAVLRDRGMRPVSPEQSAQALLAGARASAALTDDPQRWLPGAVRLSSELVALSGLILVSPGQAIARAHGLAAHGQLPEAALGRVRPDAEVSERLLGLSALLGRPTAAPVVVLAAVAHAELATVGPFGTADDVVARAVEHMVLIAGGVDPRAALVPEAGHRAAGAGYRRALDGYAVGDVTGVREWLLHCARALAHGAEVSPLGAVGRLARRPGT
jgi:hypothetical protein